MSSSFTVRAINISLHPGQSFLPFQNGNPNSFPRLPGTLLKLELQQLGMLRQTDMIKKERDLLMNDIFGY
jgi:hypothetical protein